MISLGFEIISKRQSIFHIKKGELSVLLVFSMPFNSYATVHLDKRILFGSIFNFV